MDDETLAQLYAAPAEEFVATRERLAAELARAGKKDEARELKKLRRPSPTAWATNQVVRRARGAVDGFLAASDELRARQDALLAGRGDQTAYQAGVEGLRQATAAVTAAAREALAAAGRVEDRSLVDGAIANLRVAALSADRRRELLQARLSADLTPADDGLAALGLAGATSGATRATPRPALRAVPAAGKPAEEKAREKVAEDARREAEERARALAEARENETATREAAARADAAAREATARREQARARLVEAEQAVTEAREALRAAEAAQREAARDQAHADGAARMATRRRESLERP